MRRRGPSSSSDQRGLVRGAPTSSFAAPSFRLSSEVVNLQGLLEGLQVPFQTVRYPVYERLSIQGEINGFDTHHCSVLFLCLYSGGGGRDRES